MRFDRHISAIGFAIAISAQCQAQAPTPAPSKRILVLCDGFRTQMSDLVKMATSISNRDESTGVMQMSSVAELNAERCVSAHSLLFAYELLSPGRDQLKVGQWVNLRLGQYAILTADVEYANQVVGQTTLPGVAREAQALRDRIRAFYALCDSLRPR